MFSLQERAVIRPISSWLTSTGRASRRPAVVHSSAADWARFDAEIAARLREAERGELHDSKDVFDDLKAGLRARIEAEKSPKA